MYHHIIVHNKTGRVQLHNYEALFECKVDAIWCTLTDKLHTTKNDRIGYILCGEITGRKKLVQFNNCYLVHTTHAISAPSAYGGHLIPVQVVSTKYRRDDTVSAALPSTDSAFISTQIGTLLRCVACDIAPIR